MFIEKYQIFWDTLKRYNWLQIHQALDVYIKISDLLGHPEMIELVKGVPEDLIFFYKHLELGGSVTSCIFSGCPRRSDIFL
jgi:hypothetical protein